MNSSLHFYLSDYFLELLKSYMSFADWKCLKLSLRRTKVFKTIIIKVSKQTFCPPKSEFFRKITKDKRRSLSLSQNSTSGFAVFQTSSLSFVCNFSACLLSLNAFFTLTFLVSLFGFVCRQFLS